MSKSTHGPQIQGMTTYITGGAVVRGCGIKRGADLNTAVAATANSANLGVAYEDQPTAGRTFAAVTRPGETCLGRAGAAYALDAKLATDANGKFVTATTGQNVTAIGREAATAADQLVTIELV